MATANYNKRKAGFLIASRKQNNKENDMFNKVKSLVTLDSVERVVHSKVFHAVVLVAFSVFAYIGYAQGGEAFLTEWVGGVAAAIGIFCLIFKSQGYWFWSIVNAVLWFWLYQSWGLNMTAGLQITYVILSAYGFLMWATTKDRIGLDARSWKHALGGVLGLAILGYVIYAFQNEGTFPMYTSWWWVEFLAVLISIVAFTMDAFKYRTNWLGWTATNFLFGPMFWHLGLMGPFVLTFVFQLFCIIGIIRWYREQKRLAAAGEVELVGGAKYA
jgi:nicotinamide riboside transporter PnuC